MKRLTAIFLSLLMVVSLAACGSTTSTDGESASQPPASSQSADGSETVADQDVPEGFVLIEGGSFQMGSPDSEPWRSEDETQHSVTVSDFYISPSELTQADFQMVTDGNPSSFSGENLPVENISWLDAISYCNARSELEGLTPAYTVDGQNVT